jgi:hypothetical protein
MAAGRNQDHLPRKANMKRHILFLAILVAGVASAETAVPIAGLTTDIRPFGAPVIVSFEQSANWKAQALQGINPPQTGVGFLKDQGAWYTPFIQPNSTGRYDIRGLHADAARKD